MAIKSETTEIPVVQKTTRRVVTCDLCGAEAREGEWNKSGFEHDTVTLESRHETYYPEGGGYNGVALDCCPNCFTTKVVPALEALGLRKRETSDW